MARALQAIIHEKADVGKALEIFRGFKPPD